MSTSLPSLNADTGQPLNPNGKMGVRTTVSTAGSTPNIGSYTPLNVDVPVSTTTVGLTYLQNGAETNLAAPMLVWCAEIGYPVEAGKQKLEK